MQNQYYDAFIEKIEEYEGKKYLMVDDYTLEKVLNKITRIGIEKLLSLTRILIDTDDKLLNDITLENVVTCVIKDDDKFYSQLFLEEASYDE